MPIPILRRRLNGSSSARASVHAPRAHLDPRDIAVLQGVIDAIDAMVVVALPEGTLWKWNQRCDETSGTPLTAVAGQSIWSVVRLRPNIRAAAEDSLERLISGEDRSVEFRAQWLRKDGRKARILWTARLVEIEGFRFVVATGIETTRGLKAARAMAETESRFETLLDLLPDPVVVHQNGHAVFVNRAALEQYGADSAESAMARPVMDWVAPESKEIVGERAGWMLRTGKAAPVEEERHLKFDGTAFDVEVVAAPVIFDGRPAVELVARDITARKAVASALRASEARVRAVFDQSSLGMVVLTRDSVTIESNAALERLLGYDSSELAGMRITDLIHPAEREKSLELVREMFAGRIDGFQSEQRYIAKDGHEIWVRIHAAPVRDGTGVPQLAVGTVEDISGHRTLEDQLRQASKMEALGRLASGVAHDFNNLLTVVNGYADLLAAELEGDERSDEAVAIREAGARGTELTAQLLAFGRRSKRTVEPVDLNGRIEALAPMLRRLVGEDIEFRVDLDNSIGTVEADPSQLDQIVMNLVVNGRDAMPGGGSLLISTYSIDPRSAGRPG